MSNDIKVSLDEINKVSRHLLSCLLAVKNALQESTSIVDTSKTTPLNNTEHDKKVSQQYIEQLTANRDVLIHALFEQHNKEALAKELSLINEMVKLDNEISTNSTICKKILSQQVIKLKRSEKVSKKYQQY